MVGGRDQAAERVLVPVLDLDEGDVHCRGRRRGLAGGERRQRGGGDEYADGLAGSAQVVALAECAAGRGLALEGEAALVVATASRFPQAL